MIVAGSFSLALAFVLGTNLVIAEVFGSLMGGIACAVMGVLIACLWWMLPLY